MLLPAHVFAQFQALWLPLGNGRLRAMPASASTTMFIAPPLVPCSATLARAGHGPVPTRKEVCGVPFCTRGHHCHRCARGGGLKARSKDIEKELACIHRECGHAVDTQVYVPAWNRWRTFCTPCALRSTTWDNPDAPCSSCGGQMVAELEEAILDVEFRSARIPFGTVFQVTLPA